VSERVAIDPAVAAYKEKLRALIDLRPSGTRRRIAEALGTHKSFVSQITNPAYRVPLPAQHIPVIFRICHVSAEEQRRFLEIYRRAHPAQEAPATAISAQDDRLIVHLPHFRNAAQRDRLAAAIQLMAEQMIGLAVAAEAPAESPKDEGGKP